MASNCPSKKRKSGQQSSKLSVRLFLLDPEKEIIKVTKKICSKEAKEQLKQKGWGPPPAEHCVSDDKVEFSLELTNEQFKQKLVEIYPKLENACFVFMKAGKDNILEELNPGRCCFRCYTPENVYHSERGQGKLYIRKIAENEIPQCNHGVSPLKRMRAAVGGFIRILPKPVPAVSTSTTVGTESTKNAVTSVAMPTNRQLPVLDNPGIESRVLLVPPGSMTGLDPTSFPVVFSTAESSQPAQSTVNMIPQNQLQLSTIAGTELLPLAPSSVGMVTQTRLPLSTIVSQTASTPPVDSSVKVVPQSQLPSTIYGTESRPLTFNTNAMTTPGHSLSSSGPWSTIVPSVTMGTLFPHSSTTIYNTSTITTPGPSISSSALWTVPTTTMTPSVTIATFPETPSLSTSVFSTDAMTTLVPSSLPVVPSVNAATSSLLPMPVRSMSPLDFSSVTLLPQGSNIVPESNFATSSDILQADVNSGETSSTRGNEVLSNDLLQRALLFGDVNFQALPTDVRNALESASVNYLNQSFQQPFSALPSNGRSLQSSGLYTLADTTVERGPIQEMQTNDTRNLTTLVQENMNTTEPTVNNDAFLENVKSTGKLEISLVVLNNDDLMKKLNESTIMIHTVEIQSTCKLHEVLKNYPLPSCLNVLSINDNILNYQDIYYLITSLNSVVSLLEFNLAGTKFKESSFNCFISVLINCSDLTGLCLTDNGLTKQELNCLITAFESMKNLKILNLSKNNLTDTLANDIHGGGKSIVCLPPTLEEVILSNIIHGEDFFANMIPLNLRLTKLHLSKMKLRPCDIEKLVRMLKSLPGPLSLQELVLTEVDLVDMGYEELVRVIKLLKNLKKLDLGGMKIRDKKSFVDTLSSLSFLEQLVFPDILMPNDGIPEVFKALRSLRYLKQIDIGWTPVYINEGNTLAEVLPSLQLLEKLVLGWIIDDFRVTQQLLFLAVGKLKKLKELQLQHLRGIITKTSAIALAKVLPSLRLLEKLVLGQIEFDNETQEQLFAAVGKLKYLKEFTLHYSDITQTGAEVLAGELPALKLLEKVKLFFIDFDNGSEKLLCIALTSLKYLNELDLAKTKISQTGAVALSKLLPALQLLEKLVLGEIDFDNGSEKQLFDAVGKLKRLKKFYLRTKITQTGAITLAEVLPSLQLLEKLVLTNIDFDNGSNEQFLDSVGKLGYLKKLYLQFSEITQTGIKALTKVLGSLQLLEKLLFGHIHFYNDNENEIESKFFYALGNLRYLKELGLWSTYITQTGIVVLAEVLPSLQLLEKLVLGNIDFDNGSEEKLFYVIMKLRSLKKLGLVSTELTQTGTGALAEVLPSLQVLEELTLGEIDFDNTSEKQLFAAVAKSKYLKKLDLRFTKITQTGAVTLAEVLPSLQLLETLWLGEIDLNNESEKQLFAAVGSLNWLNYLLLRRTKITDEGAATVIGVLPTLRNLRSIELPDVESDENETSSDAECDEHETPVSKIKAAGRLVPGLCIV